MLQSYVWLVLLSGCETVQKKLQAAEMWFHFEKDFAENLVDEKEKQSGSTEHGRGWSPVVGNTL